MRLDDNGHPSSSMRGIADRGWIAVAAILLTGLITIAYSYFHQNRIGLVVGLVMTAAGVLNGVIHGLRH